MLPFRVVFAKTSEQTSSPHKTFEVPSATDALVLAQRITDRGPAEVWQGDKLVCRIVESGGGFWEVG